jgi:hypothetical protein
MYRHAQDFTSRVVYDPYNRYAVEGGGGGGGGGSGPSSRSWFDFSVPPSVAAACPKNGSKGLLRLVDQLRPCTRGNQIAGSPTVCEGTRRRDGRLSSHRISCMGTRCNGSPVLGIDVPCV